jgi:hypothetical protein
MPTAQAVFTIVDDNRDHLRGSILAPLADGS